MTWTQVQASPEASATATSVTPVLGAASTAGTLLTAKLISSQGTATWTLPAGWVQDAAEQNGGITHCEIWHLDPASNPGGITSVLCTSSATANIKAVVSEYATDVASPVVTVNATGTGLAGAVTSCTVTTGTAAAAGDLAECCFHEHFSAASAIAWTDPAGFTLTAADTASAGNHLYSGYDLAAAAGTLTVTGTASVASDNAHGWSGVVVSYTAAPAGGGAAGVTLVSSLEGIADGTTVTPANSGGVSGNAFDAVTTGGGAACISDAASAAHGSQGMKMTTGGTAASVFTSWTAASVAAGTIRYFRLYVKLGAYPPSTMRLFRCRSGGTFAAALAVTSAGKVSVIDSASAQMKLSAMTLPLGTMVRIEGFFVASATAGQGEFKIFTAMDSTTPDESQTSNATFNTLAGFDTADFGIVTAEASYTLQLDDLGLSDSGYIGPVVTGGGGGGGTAGLVGAYLNPAKFGSGVTQAQAISDWQTITGRTLTVRRVYYPAGQIPAAIPADLKADAVAGRKVCMSLRPAFSPPSAADLSALDTFLASCKAAGLIAAVSLWQEPYNSSQASGASPGLTVSLEVAAWRFYAPTIRQYYPTVFDTSSFAVNHHSENSYYPGDAYIDQIATDFYCSEFDGGERLDLAVSLADNASPPKPFGLWEMNSSRDATRGQTQAQAQAYYNYITSFFLARLAAGKDNADIMLFNSDTNLSQETPITSGSDYRAGMWAAMFDALNASGPPSGAQTWHVTGALTTLTSFSAAVSGGASPPPPPPPPPPLPPVNPVIVTTADWTFGAGPRQPAGGVTLALTDARSRTAVFRTAPDTFHEASFVIDGRSPQAAGFRELSSDLQLYRNGELLAALRIVPTADTLDADSHTVSVTALDYREVLRRRLIFPDDLNTFWDSTDQAVIAWQMIQGTQARPGGNLGISRGLGRTTDTTRSFQTGPADFVGDDITRIAQMAGGFDWDITAYAPGDLRLDIWSPQRGADRGVILEYGGGLVASITRAVDPTTYANSWLVTGQVPSPQPGPIAASSFWDDTAGIATDPAGRWDQAQGTQLKDQQSIRDRLAWHLADSVTVIPAYTVVMQPGTWGGPGHIWLGDLVTVRIKSGRLNVNDQLRVMEIAVAIGDDGDETVTLQAGRLPWRLEKHIPLILRRLRALETL